MIKHARARVARQYLSCIKNTLTLRPFAWPSGCLGRARVRAKVFCIQIFELFNLIINIRVCFGFKEIVKIIYRVEIQFCEP